MMTMLIRPLLMIGKRSLKVLYRSQCSDISNPIHIQSQLCYLYQWWCHHYYSPNVTFGANKNSRLEKVLSSLITRLPASWRRAVGQRGREEGRKRGGRRGRRAGAQPHFMNNSHGNWRSGNFCGILNFPRKPLLLDVFCLTAPGSLRGQIVNFVSLSPKIQHNDDGNDHRDEIYEEMMICSRGMIWWCWWFCERPLTAAARGCSPDGKAVEAWVDGVRASHLGNKWWWGVQ